LSEKGEETEATRGMKHLLIHRLLQYGLRVFETVAMKKGVDIAVCEAINGELKCISAQVRTSSLHPPKGRAKQWYYEFSVAGRDSFADSPMFFHILCLEEKDELRPVYLVIPNHILKRLIEKRLEAPSSWKERQYYTRTLTRKQLHELGWINYKDKFELIDEALGIKDRKSKVRESDEYWNSKAYEEEQEHHRQNSE